MTSTKTTLLTNVFNEEYLLPFWLNHHKNMFDDIIIIDYNSTDNSMQICKSICPECKIITTRNERFKCKEIDEEFMDIENGIEGIKIVLNTTEFLFCETSIKDIFIDDKNPIAYAINVITPYSINNYNVTNKYELFNNLFNNDVVYHNNRGLRYLHTHSNGNYIIGRHHTNNHYVLTNKAHIIWFGYYPMNDNLLKRKLQIAANMTQYDKDHRLGWQHFYSKQEMLNINNENAKSGVSFKCINESLYNLLNEYNTTH